MMRPFGVLAHVCLDAVHRRGKRWVNALGGAGTFAACGMRMASTNPVVVSAGVGEDFLPEHASWLERWSISEAGLVARDSSTVRNIIHYQSDDDRTEAPVLGEEHFRRLSPRLDDLPEGGRSCRGIYRFGDADPNGWEALGKLRREHGVALLWELIATESGPQGWRRLQRLLPEVDVISLNLREAAGLLGEAQPAAAAAQLVEWGARVACVRLGDQGSLLATTDDSLHVGLAPSDRVVDPTGAGNAFSGALLAAWNITGSLAEAGRMAAAAASFIVEQHGPPDAPPNRAQITARSRRVTIRRPAAAHPTRETLR